MDTKRKVSINPTKWWWDLAWETMTKKGWSQRELAKAAGVNEKNISTLKKRLSLDSALLEKIAKALEIESPAIIRLTKVWDQLSADEMRVLAGQAESFAALRRKLSKP